MTTNSSSISIQSKLFGVFETDFETIMHFEKGIPGLESIQEYALVTIQEYKPIVWMISTDGIYHFPLVNYSHIDVSDLDEISLNTYKSKLDHYLKKNEEEHAYIIIKLDQAIQTVSLQSPILINPKKQIGKQLILEKNELVTGGK